MTEGVLELLATWVSASELRLAEHGIGLVCTQGPADRDPRAAWVDFESKSKSARLIVWDNGLAELAIGNFVKGEILLEEHREIESTVGLDDVEMTIRAWLIDE